MAKIKVKLVALRPIAGQTVQEASLRLIQDDTLEPAERLAQQRAWGILKLGSDHPLLLTAKLGDHFLLELTPTNGPPAPAPAPSRRLPRRARAPGHPSL